ncbi:sugar-binding transcriptional regulator [Levilactobacillus cerevisiae]|uniref:sugar-binding transcriptional regulator n=1 Tax=Levilactobacillus cerevisiae TaxID=1704076 RepID=UPI000F7B4720|nr:sugar-binding transcriptional regulator [Levilactobacillus cerevisiae]
MALSKKQIERILAISRYYYQDDLSQQEIAQKMNLSRPTVSKSLQLARENNIVTITIQDPFENTAVIRQQLQEKYHLKDVVIAEQANYDEQGILEQLGAVTANYLDQIVTDGVTIGINWGRTMAAVANHLHPSHSQNVRLVQLKGSVTNSGEDNFSAAITQKFNQAFHTQASLLPLPIIFGDAKVKQLAMRDQFIHQVVSQGNAADIALYTVGTTRPTAMLFQSGYLDDAQIHQLQTTAVGDVLSHYITAAGELAVPELDQRTVAIPLPQLAKKRYAILIAGGQAKLQPIHAALVGGHANVLIVDQAVAKALVAL